MTTTSRREAQPIRARASRAVATSRGLVLDLIRSRGPISRVELAASTGLTQATMSYVVRDLLDDGLVLEIGRGESTGGKRPTMLDIDPVSRFAVGVQLGADEITYVVTNLGCAIIGRTRTHGPVDDPKRVVADIAADLTALVSHLGVSPDRIVGLGVVAPGPLDLDAGMILAPSAMTAWHGFPLRDRLREATGLAVLMDNDATAAAVGEFWGGALPGSKAHLTVYMGAGIGSGIVLGGTVYRGASSNTGELGQTLVHSSRDGNWATIEELAAPRAVAALGRAAAARGELDGVRLSPDSNAHDDFGAIATAAVRGHPAALALITASAEVLASSVVSAANLLDLDSVVLAGPSFATAGSIYVELVKRRLDAQFFAGRAHEVRVRISSQVAEAAAVGGAALVLQQHLAPRSFSG